MRVFVFGSNLGGRHGRGSAREAKEKHGAEYGVGAGRTGNAYAIPTKDTTLRVLPLDVISSHVKVFLAYASEHPDMEFDVVAVGCGLAGYSPSQIAPMFYGATDNVHLPQDFLGTIRATA